MLPVFCLALKHLVVDPSYSLCLISCTALHILYSDFFALNFLFNCLESDRIYTLTVLFVVLFIRCIYVGFVPVRSSAAAALFSDYPLKDLSAYMVRYECVRASI